MPSSSCAWPFREVCCRLVKDIDALQLVHFVREAQGFQNTRTSFFERVTAVTEYYGVLERVVQPKEKSYEVGTFRDEASRFLGVSSYVHNTFWKNGMVFQSLFHGLEISFHCGKIRSRFIRGLKVNITEGVRFSPSAQRQVM